MATLSDENATNVGRSVKEALSTLFKFMLRSLAKKWEERAERNFKKLEKNHPERIRTADIETKDLDKFKVLAHQQGIKLYQIEQEKHKTPTLKYDIRDEHKIVGIFKQLEEGYRIPENQLMALMEKYFDTEKLTNRISKVTGMNLEEVEKELKDPEYYQDEKLFGKDFQDKIQEMYDKAYKEVTGRENTEDITQDIEKETPIISMEDIERMNIPIPPVENRNEMNAPIPMEDRNEIEKRLDSVKSKQDKAKTSNKEQGRGQDKKKTKQKEAEIGMER